MPRRCSECRKTISPAVSASTKQRVCGATCRAARDRKLARARRRRELDEARSDERERQRASRKRRAADSCHAPPSALKYSISREQFRVFAALAVDTARADWGITDPKLRFALQPLLLDALPHGAASAQTDNFSASFSICQVSLTRSWLKLALLSTPTWWMYGTPAGAYSTGKANDNPGLLPLLTSSFFVIRDLKLTASWSQEDQARLPQAASFGCFDLRGASLNGATLEQPGLQIIAWNSRPMPKLPPLPAAS